VAAGYGIAAAAAALLLALSFVALAVHGSHVLWGRVPAGVSVARAGFGAAALFAAPLAAVCVLGLWTPGPLADVFDSVRAILGATHG
jgi:uncharacterized iron-regulated membrane protein